MYNLRYHGNVSLIACEFDGHRDLQTYLQALSTTVQMILVPDVISKCMHRLAGSRGEATLLQ